LGIMENEYQQAPLPPPQGPIGQPGYNWQYNQELPEGTSGALGPQSSTPPVPPQMPPNVPPSHLPVQAPGEQDNTLIRPRRTAQFPPRYQEPIPDMGTSLGYGQGMEYQFFNPPQPSQPMPQLRMERLQQLRQQRLRRDRQHNRPNFTSLLRRPREGAIPS